MTVRVRHISNFEDSLIISVLVTSNDIQTIIQVSYTTGITITKWTTWKSTAELLDL